MTDRVQNFNSHAHVERDMKVLIACEESQISTHTLTWSVTICFWWWFCQPTISTHTLTWSVTNCNSSPDFDKRFQLTRSRGAWRQTHINRRRSLRFQLTRSRGAWRQQYWMLQWRFRFQLTRSRGAWHRRNTQISQGTYNFNSHAHVERDDDLEGVS